jgi:hypothetical protein
LAGIALAKFRVAFDAWLEHLWLAARSNPNLKFARFYGKPTAPTIA